MTTTRKLILPLFAAIALALAVLAFWAGPSAETFAGSSGTVVPDVGAAPVAGPALAGSSGTVVPDAG